MGGTIGHDTKFHRRYTIDASGVLSDPENGKVFEEEVIRVIISGVGLTNVINLEVKLLDQTSWTVLEVLTGEVNKVIDISTWDQVRFNVTVLDGTGRLEVSGFYDSLQHLISKDSEGRDTLRVSSVPLDPGETAGPTDILVSNTIIEEGQPTNTLVGTITTVDGEPPIVVTINSDPGNAFQIVGNELRTSRVLDFSTEPSLNVGLLATDNNGNTLSKGFVISVTEAGGFQNFKSYEFSGNGFILVNNNLYAGNANTTWWTWWKGSKPSSAEDVFNSRSGTLGSGMQLQFLSGAQDVKLFATRNNGSDKEYTYGGLSIFDNQWHLIGFTVANNAIEFWVDGQLQTPTVINQDQNTQNINSNATDIYIGANATGTGAFLNGKLDEIGYATTVLNNAKWLLLYNNGVAVDPNTVLDVADGFRNWYRADGDGLPNITDNKGGINAVASNITISMDAPTQFDNSVAVEFDQTNYLVGNGSPDFAQAKSFSFWLNRTAPLGTDILYGNRPATNTDNGFSIYFDNNGANRMYFEIESPGGQDLRRRWSLGASTIGNYAHVCITMPAGNTDATQVNCYVNGSLVAANQTSNSLVAIPAMSNTIAFGAGTSGGSPIDALLDEFSIWDRELSGAEVQELYNLGVPFDVRDASFGTDVFQFWRMGDLNNLSSIITDVIQQDAVVMINYDPLLFTNVVP
jgi:hypothetical protein